MIISETSSILLLCIQLCGTNTYVSPFLIHLAIEYRMYVSWKCNYSGTVFPQMLPAGTYFSHAIELRVQRWE